MNTSEVSSPKTQNALKIALVMLHGVIVLNFILYGLSLSSWFEGSADKAGFVDHLLGAYRLGGFRADCVWLFFSTILIFFVLLFFLSYVRKNRTARLTALLCVAAVVAFFMFVVRMVVGGLVW